MYRSQNWKCDNVKLIKKDLGYKNISVILWLWILLEEEIEVPGENHRPIDSINIIHVNSYFPPWI
jgi:hypothetical protein